MSACAPVPAQLAANLASAPTSAWRAASSRSVHPSARADGSVLEAVASGLAAVTVPWELAGGDTPTEPVRQQLLATEVYDVWVIYCPSGTELDAHDHGPSAGALAVVSGALDEDLYVGDTVLTTRIEPGQCIAFAVGQVHALANRGTAGATSIHVYSPPLEAP
jgi:predicted metal-dependent enzyme (double-stranded beta helix superfamily)